MADDSKWALRYPDKRSDFRVLITLPTLMHRDMRVLARGRGLTTSEFMRQLITREIKAEIDARPELARSFKGQVAAHAPDPHPKSEEG